MRTRFRVEAALAGLSGLLCLLTLMWRDWIEGVFGVDLDAHGGWLEWLIVVLLLWLAIALGRRVQRQRRRVPSRQLGSD
jgi:hypothetical protein